MIKWGSFQKGKNGEWDGLNNAAIYSFNSNIINSFVREMFQNSIDARDNSLERHPITGKLPPLRIKINYKEIDKSVFPDFQGFRSIFKKISEADPNSKHKKFFKNGFHALDRSNKVSLFIFEDFNTCGLHGGDQDPKSTFNACVISEGISIKSDSTSGGSFGIGKNAIFGLSKLRTVFYSSLNRQKEFIFQGKAKLASYYDDDGNTRDNKIYCGQGVEFSSIRKAADMPEKLQEIFLRTEPGLSQYALAPVENDNWPEEFLKAILRNYWLLLDKEQLIVELYNKDNLVYEISKTNLEELLLNSFNPETYKPEKVKPQGNPYEFYNCYKNGKSILEENFPYLGKVRFFYNELDNKNTNAIAYLRNDMVVYTDSIYGFGSINYCGVFLCDDNKGNSILSAMEPPTHDDFSEQRLEEKREEFSSKDGEKILDAIKKLIKKGLKEIKDQYVKPAEEIPWLNDLMSSFTGKNGSGKGNRTNKISEVETPEKKGAKVKKTLNFGSLRRNQLINDKTGEVEGVGAGGTKEKKKGSGPKPGSRPGPNPGPNPGSNPVKKSKIKARFFKTENDREIEGKLYRGYRLLLESDKKIDDTDILIAQQGEVGSLVMFELKDVSLADGTPISYTTEIDSNNEIIAYKLNNVSVPNIIDVFVDEPYKSSFRILNS